jgi:signal transduction histidine kinase
LAAVARETSRQLREAADARGVDVQIASDLPVVTVDVGRLELLLTNLISNAIKYCDPAKAERFVEIAQVSKNGAECVFYVRDNGLGMNSEQLHSLFTPFYRGHVERDAELGNEGLGLGLGIVRDCAAAIGASISVEGVPGNGVTFTITLPVRPRR